MSSAVEVRVISQQVLVVRGELRDHQVVELLDSARRRTALFSRYLNVDGTRWIRHGLFQAFHASGSLKSEGSCDHGLEHGLWRDRYESGATAAEGNYFRGHHIGTWRYWSPDGSPEESEEYGPAPVTLEREA